MEYVHIFVCRRYLFLYDRFPQNLELSKFKTISINSYRLYIYIDTEQSYNRV